jgi:hypothetical protein
MNLEYIDTIAPEHNKTSCNDRNRNNARYSADDFGGCYRCTLLEAAQSANLSLVGQIDGEEQKFSRRYPIAFWYDLELPIGTKLFTSDFPNDY